MKRKLLVTAGLLFLQTAKAQVSGIEWQESYSSLNLTNMSMHIHGNASGNGFFFTQNYDEYFPNQQQYGILSKTTLGGTLLWNREFVQTNTEHATKLYDIQSTAGGYVLAGEIIPTGNNDSFAKQGRMIKVDENGNTLWTKNYPVSAGWDFIYFTKVIATQDSGFLLGGEISNGIDDLDFFILKTDANGNEQWRKTLGGSDLDFLDDMALNAEGNFYLSGRTQSTDGDVSNGGNVNSTYATWAVKLSSTGTILWENAFEGASHDYPYVRITDTADNGCALIYIQTKNISHGVEITKFYSNGTLHWQNDYNPYPGFWNDMNIIKSDNGQIVFGSGGSFIKGLNMNGDILWDWQNPDPAYTLRRGELTQTPDKGYLFTGENIDENKVEAIKLAPVATLAVQNAGNISENKLYPNPSNGNFTISSKSGKISSITISDMSGKNVYSENIASAKHQFHLESLAQGIYFVEILFENSRKETRKIMIKK
ncbi:T9SS type A sorting domain-containing protein [Chryseobacterium sp. MIQD13]|uniref:T9SS type A sorting domain-containing protein n=1 Tax=Chryseobacterium sp. MIQD13 TaxID=3422310 RepID=UPI003D2DF7B7